MSDLLLIDLSSILHQQYHITSEDPDPNVASKTTVAKVRALAHGVPRVAVCCDIGPSFRRTIDPLYKANRKPKEAPLFHQMQRAAEMLKADGLPVWVVEGFEADDLIASATERAVMEDPETIVTIVTMDKDLLQLVGERVFVQSPKDRSVLGPFDVETKLGVRPNQVRDFLTLVGDKADNVPGCAKVGEVTAAKLLKEFDSIEGIYKAMYSGATPTITPALRTNLKDFEPRVEKTRSLISLRFDVQIPFEELARDRVNSDVASFITDNEEPEMDTPDTQPSAERQPLDARAHAGDGAAMEAGAAAEPVPPTALAVREPEVLPVAADYERQLDPRSPKEARSVAVDLFQSRMFADYGSPQAVLSTVMLGRELGLPAMASLRAVHVIEGKHSLSAATMVALVLKSGFAEYFEAIEFDEKHAVVVTKRKGGRHEQRYEYTVEHAKTAGLVKEKSGWVKNPREMCLARAQSSLARLVYPDVVGGLYTPEELRDIKESAAA